MTHTPPPSGDSESAERPRCDYDDHTQCDLPAVWYVNVRGKTSPRDPMRPRQIRTCAAHAWRVLIFAETRSECRLTVSAIDLKEYES